MKKLIELKIKNISSEVKERMRVREEKRLEWINKIREDFNNGVYDEFLKT